MATTVTVQDKAVGFFLLIQKQTFIAGNGNSNKNEYSWNLEQKNGFAQFPAGLDGVSGVERVKEIHVDGRFIFWIQLVTNTEFGNFP